MTEPTDQGQQSVPVETTPGQQIKDAFSELGSGDRKAQHGADETEVSPHESPIAPQHRDDD